MEIKKHQLYQLYLCYLDSRNLSKGPRSLSEISESMFSDFLSKYELNPGFKEKWKKKLLENHRDDNIKIILEKDFDDSQYNKNEEISIDEEFEILFDFENEKDYENLRRLDDDIFDF